MARKKKLSENDQKQLLILKATYEMQLKEREDALLRGKTDSVERMDLIVKDTLNQIAKIDADFANQCIQEVAKKKNTSDLIDIINKNEENSGTLFDALEKLDVTQEKFEKIKEPTPKENSSRNIFDDIDADNTDIYKLADEVGETLSDRLDYMSSEVEADNAMYNNVDPLAQYDLIPLPSKGECYKIKVDKIPVGYLTAADENLITSPNLYESGTVIDILLKKKILNKDIDIDNLISGDVDAIMLFLRGTSYGNDFPISTRDPQTGRSIETNVDLSTLKYKPFSLKGDENGHFDFTLPRTQAKVKFKFLTKKEEKLLNKLSKKEVENVASFELDDAVNKIRNAIKGDKKLSDSERSVIIDANDKIEKWSKSMKKSENGSLPYTKTVTNAMEMEIVSINGETDKKAIHDFIMNMPAGDSLAFRRYVYDNQPGVDFKVTVERPESMGGGSFPCFLEWDDSIFWNIA